MFTCCRALLISGCTRLPMRITLHKLKLQLNNSLEFQMAFQLLMSNLTARTNAQTNMGEMWWGEYLQIDETRTEFQGMCPIPITVNLKIYSL